MNTSKKIAISQNSTPSQTDSCSSHIGTTVQKCHSHDQPVLEYQKI